MLSANETNSLSSKSPLIVSGRTLFRSALALALPAVGLLSSQMSLALPQVQTTEVVMQRPETTGCYAVQVGAYVKRAEALAVLNRLSERFSYPTTLTSVVTQDDTLWRVRMLTTSRAETLKASERLLQEQGVKAWIIPTPCTARAKGNSEGANHDRKSQNIAASTRALPVLTTAPAVKPVIAPTEYTHATIVAAENASAEDRDARDQESLNRVSASGDAASPAPQGKEAAQGSVINGAPLDYRRRRRGKSGSEMIGILPDLEISSGGLDGVKILDITPFGPAARAGLVAGDVIVSIDGIAVTSDEALNTELASRKAGSRIRVTFMHIAWLMEATLTIETEFPF